MKFLLLFLILPAAAMADLPHKPALGRYASLWTDSPFTSKPVQPINQRAIENPLEDYALGGISKLKDGYYAVLINKKKPDERVVIKPGGESDFQVLNVTWAEGDWKDTVATVQSGTHRRQIGFDEKVLATTNTPPRANPQQNSAQRPNIPGVKPSNPANNRKTRKPRPRVVRPPQPKAGNNGR